MKEVKKSAVITVAAVAAFGVTGVLSAFAAGAPKDKASVAAGKALFGQYCATCHGNSGKGDGVASKGLNPPPRNFTGKFKFGKDDASLFKTIGKGSPGTAMPGWAATMNDKQRWQVVSFIKTLMKKETKKK